MRESPPVRLAPFRPDLLDAVLPWFDHVYDRWTLWDPATERITTTYPGLTMGSAYVVDPARWGRGHGRAALLPLVRAPELADVTHFVLGVEPDDTAGLRAAAAAGFRPLTTAPDSADMVYLRLTSGPSVGGRRLPA